MNVYVLQKEMILIFFLELYLQNLYSYYLNQTKMHKLPHPSNPSRNSHHNSLLYQKLLEDERLVSENSYRESQYQQQQNAGEQSEKVEMVIEFGGSSNASIMVGPHDDPNTLAKRFCFKHNIDPRIIATLATSIKNLQMNTFNPHKYKQSSYRIDKNQTNFDDKENRNMSNYHSRQNKSGQKSLQSTKIRRSRNKTVQSSFNDSEVVSNSKSGACTVGSTSNRYNVFERLYQDSKKKAAYHGIQNQNSTKRNESRMSLNNSNTNKSLNQSSINSCLYIYEKNTKLKQESRKHNEHLLQLKKQKEAQSCKFKPNINPLSNLIATKLRELDQSSIMNKSTNDKQMLKIKEYLLKKEQQQMKQCTFKPKIITKISSQNSKYSTERYLQLHEDHNYRQARKKQISQEKQRQAERQHHPSINKVSKIIVNKDFFERLQEDKTKRLVKRESMQKLRQQENKQFKPATGRPPVNRNLGEKTIGQYLYEKARQSKALSVKMQPKIMADPKSSQIYEQSKKCAFQYLFYLLDSDQDGLISSTRINIGALGEQILRLMAPLLSEMEEVEVELNQQEFFEAFERLYSTFSVDQKNLILKFHKNKGQNNKNNDKPTFQPTLNQKSLMIARQLCGDEGDIYENSVMRLKEKENKLNRLRAERMLDEYNECTFHPKLRY